MQKWTIAGLFLIGILFLGVGFMLGRSSQGSLAEKIVNNITISKIPTKDTLSESDEKPTNVQDTVIVTKVVDGDTIQLSSGKTVRYIGIDTPETSDPRSGVECFGKEAAAKNRELVEGKTVRLEKDVSEVDRYGRLLRYVYVGNLFVNDELVRQGFAHASAYPPDIAYQDQFRAADQEAREEKRGLWAACGSDSGSSVQSQSLQNSTSNMGSKAQIEEDKDCGDFKTHDEAQAFFISQGGPSQDPHKLDQDKDGNACETLP